VARPRFAHEQRFDRQPRTQRRFHQPNSFHAYNSVVVAFARKRGTEALEPAVLTARDKGIVSLDSDSRGYVFPVSHAHQPSKPPPSGKAMVSRDFRYGAQKFSALNALHVYGRFTRLRIDCRSIATFGSNNEGRQFVR
jgi:hypothetical protein